MPWLLFLLMALVAPDEKRQAPPPAPPVAVPAAAPDAPIPAPAEPEPVSVSTITGQARADYDGWLAGSPAARAQTLGFESFLRGQDLLGIIPTWQLTRTASDFDKCSGPAFEVPPPAEWNHVADTLRFIKRHVEPVIGDVEVLSGYRNAELNACAGGAKESAHRRFFALDLTPVRESLTREGMIRSICSIHAWRGRGYDIGLGFYSGMRFHLDSKGFRKWGPNGKGATSPCVTG